MWDPSDNIDEDPIISDWITIQSDSSDFWNADIFDLRVLRLHEEARNFNKKVQERRAKLARIEGMKNKAKNRIEELNVTRNTKLAREKLEAKRWVLFS